MEESGAGRRGAHEDCCADPSLLCTDRPMWTAIRVERHQLKNSTAKAEDEFQIGARDSDDLYLMIVSLDLRKITGARVSECEAKLRQPMSHAYLCTSDVLTVH